MAEQPAPAAPVSQQLRLPEKPAYAVHLKLTPELKHALVAAQGSGEAVSLRFRHEQNDVS